MLPNTAHAAHPPPPPTHYDGTTPGPNPAGSAYASLSPAPAPARVAPPSRVSRGAAGGPSGWNSAEKGEPRCVLGGCAAKWPAISASRSTMRLRCAKVQLRFLNEALRYLCAAAYSTLSLGIAASTRCSRYASSALLLWKGLWPTARWDAADAISTCSCSAKAASRYTYSARK
jgi:hypothetical protein